MMGIMPFDAPELNDPARARAVVTDLVDAGVDGIKLFASSPSGAALDAEVILATVAEAHRLGKPIFVHPNSGAEVLLALRAGVDVIAHTTPRSGAWEEAVLEAAGERPVALTPTLALWKHFLRHDRSTTRDRIVETAVEQLRAWRERGATVCYGSDLGAVDYDPREEYRLMADAGMSFRDLLASLTTAPAAHFGQAHALGRVAPGLAGDLTVFAGDPQYDVGVLADVRYTIRSGEVIFSGK